MTSPLESILQDVRFGGRQLRRAPGFFAAAVLTLALGIGANVTMFSVVYGVLLKPLPFDEPERLVGVWSQAPAIGWNRAVLCAAQYFTYRDEARTLEDVAVWTERALTVTGAGEPERVHALMVTDGFLPLLRVKAALGRRFSAEDDRPGAPSRVMLTHAYWQRRFGGSATIVGQYVTIGGRPRQIIGVLPADFRFLEATPAILVPLGFDRAATTIQDFSYVGLARLKPGVSLEQANRDVARMLALVPQKFPASPALGPAWFRDARMGADVHALSEDAAGDIGKVLWVLMGTIAMVLLIACANVANLFLARADSRHREMTVRAALGAGRLRLATALLTESVMLGLCGGAVGVALAFAALRVVRATAPAALPRVDDIALNPVVLVFAAAVSIAAGVLFGSIPVLRFASPRLEGLRDGGRSASLGRERHRMRSALVVSEIAVALVLLIASGLMIRTFNALRQVDPGFTRGQELATFTVAIPNALAPTPEQVMQRHQEIAGRIGQVPGVQAVGLASAIALGGGGMSNPMLVEDFPLPEGQVVQSRRMKWIAPGYFETMGTRLVAGRLMTWADLYAFRPAVIVNERLAREYWKTPAAAIGRRIRATTRSPWREVIGVVGNERDGLAQDAPGIMYYPALCKDFWMPSTYAERTLTYVVRSTRVGSPSLMNEIRRAVWSVDRTLPLADVRTMEKMTAESMAQTSFALVMLGLAGAVSLLLGVVGIYGVISYVAAQRTREIGIRMALGARPADVARQFMRQGLVLAAVGSVLGIAAAAASSRLMASLLFGVTGTDPATYVVVASGLAAIAVLAGYVPSRRASRLDPVAALRSDG